MTGYVNPSGPLGPLSATTLGAMRDLGYAVDMGKAQAFDILTTAALVAPGAEAAIDLRGDVLRVPMQYADDTVEAP